MNRLLAELPRFATAGATAMKPGLDRIGALLEVFGHPERNMPVVLVAGTNGKGSVASMTAAILTAGGVRTGLHTSPHLLHVTERMRVDGQPASPAWLDETVERFRTEFSGISPSFFEALVGLSLLYFREQGAEAAVVEVGLGGRLDATNILDASVSVITSIGLDHTEMLGDTLEAIAREKGGIIKPGRPVVLGDMGPGARAVLETMARAVDAPVLDGADLPRTAAPDLTGPHQLRNARVAVAAARALLDGNLPEAVVCDGLARTMQLSGLRARLETVRESPRVVVDMGHNAEAIATALSALGTNPVDVVVLGVLRDKDTTAIGQALKDFPGSVWVVPTTGDRGLTATELSEQLGRKNVRQMTSVENALKNVSERGLSALFIGSHHVAEAVFHTLALEHHSGT